jgi:hypothetical protein
LLGLGASTGVEAPQLSPFAGSFRVGDSGFEPLTSSASKKYDTLLEVSATCKIAANQHICALAHFPAFQEILSGCCTVAAQM